MQKRPELVLVMILVFSLLATLTLQAHATEVKLIYDDIHYTSSEPLILENGVTYASVRSVSAMRQEFDAHWDESSRSAHFMSNGIDMSIAVGDNHIYANGRMIQSDAPTRLVNGRVYLPIRTLAKALGATVEYDNKTSTVRLKTDGGYIGTQSSYSSDDLYWMERIIHSESCGEPYAGKLLVGSVVMNRVKSREFPNSVYSVIFDRKYAVQFTPVANGTIYDRPCNDCANAAKAVLEGANLNYNAMYFVNRDTVPVSWVSDNRPEIYKVGSHTFYY